MIQNNQQIIKAYKHYIILQVQLKWQKKPYQNLGSKFGASTISYGDTIIPTPLHLEEKEDTRVKLIYQSTNELITTIFNISCIEN